MRNIFLTVLFGLTLTSCTLVSGPKTITAIYPGELKSPAQTATVLCGSGVSIEFTVNPKVPTADLKRSQSCYFSALPGSYGFSVDYTSRLAAGYELRGHGITHGRLEAGKTYVIQPIILDNPLFRADQITFDLTEVPNGTTPAQARSMLQRVKAQ